MITKDQILTALEPVKLARESCPFSLDYRGSKPDYNKACPKCGQLSNGNNGTCIVDFAMYTAVSDVENLVK